MNEEKTVFVLFQTDQWGAKNSRIFLGVFDSGTEAVQSYLDNCEERYDAKYEIVIAEVGKFEEL